MNRLAPAVSCVLATVVSLLTSGCCNGDPERPRAVEERGQEFLLCGRVVDDDEEETFEVSGTTLRRRGFVIERLGEGDGETRLGVLAGVEEWNEPNAANLSDLGAWFTTQRVEAIIVAGGLGANRETCLHVLEALAETKVPVLSLIGASADFRGYRDAVKQARQKTKNVIDLSLARRVIWDGVDVVSLPGYHNPFYLGHRRGGCAYREDDVEALDGLVRDADQPVLFVSSSPPRGRGSAAVDWARGGANIGDPRLTSFLAKQGDRVPYGIFGHVYEAGGNATSDAAGRHAVAPDQWSKTLYLNPGAAESVPYDLASGGRSRGMGAVVEIGAKGARYRVHHVARVEPPSRPAPAKATPASPDAGGGS